MKETLHDLDNWAVYILGCRGRILYPLSKKNDLDN